MGKLKEYFMEQIVDNSSMDTYDYDLAMEEMHYENTIRDVVELSLVYGLDSITQEIRRRYDNAKDVLDQA